MGSSFSLHRARSADRRAGPRRLAGVARADRRLPRLADLSHRRLADRTAARKRRYVEQAARGALIIPAELRPRSRARHRRAGPAAGRRIRRQHGRLLAGYAGGVTGSFNAAHGAGAAARPRGPGRRPVLVQPRAVVEEVLRPRHLRDGDVDVSAAARHAGDGARRRAEDDPAGVRLEHLGRSSSCSARSLAFMVVAFAEAACSLLALLFTFFGVQAGRRSDAVHRRDAALRLLRRVVRHDGRARPFRTRPPRCRR